MNSLFCLYNMWSATKPQVVNDPRTQIPKPRSKNQHQPWKFVYPYTDSSYLKGSNELYNSVIVKLNLLVHFPQCTLGITHSTYSCFLNTNHNAHALKYYGFSKPLQQYHASHAIAVEHTQCWAQVSSVSAVYVLYVTCMRAKINQLESWNLPYI